MDNLAHLLASTEMIVDLLFVSCSLLRSDLLTDKKKLNTEVGNHIFGLVYFCRGTNYL